MSVSVSVSKSNNPELSVSDPKIYLRNKDTQQIKI